MAKIPKMNTELPTMTDMKTENRFKMRNDHKCRGNSTEKDKEMNINLGPAVLGAQVS